MGGRPGVTRVYAGLDAVGRPVAIKTLDPEADAVGAARFAQERAVHASLMLPPPVPHVLPLHAEQPDGWLVTRWAAGGALDERLARHETLSRTAVARVIDALLLAVQALEQRGIAHRDIKPSNVLIDGPDVWLADFGLAARRVDGDVWEALPAPWRETAIGTPEWRAPELGASPPHTTVSTDRYGVGRVGLALLARVDDAPAAWRTTLDALCAPDPAERITCGDARPVFTASTP